MSRAENPHSTNPPGVTLTRKGEAYAAQQAANAEHFAALANLRREASREIARLLDFLDRIDGDWDLEDNGDDEPTLVHYRSADTGDGELEHSLGWTRTGQMGDNDAWAGGDLELDNADREPSLGSTTGLYCHDQTTWAQGAKDDREAFDDDLEPSLGWNLEGDKGEWFSDPRVGLHVDIELDPHIGEPEEAW